ncbi:arylesterase [Shewanella colwelliana]|uniref:GDSL-type esterase/lipase family protein n=1 Tax=Shewanella colwelliana TaxID=23 RepID=UPI001BC6296A|nr:GDSL-type esterase/lipase family protein [Shewanella colwelliana]GIU17933.1 arylesterase [Shewanella colwelliana]
MKMKLFAVAALILMVIVVLSQQGHQLEPLSPEAKILAFGDSLTEGVGASEGADYPQVLSTMLGRTVVNAGISGETTSEGLIRFEEQLDHWSPGLVLLLEGGNDFLRNVNEQKVKNNLKQMIEIANARNIEVVLIAVPQKSLWLAPSEIYAELAAQFELLLIEDILLDLLKLPEVKSDSIHFNDEGYYRLAKHIEQRLVKAGAI